MVCRTAGCSCKFRLGVLVEAEVVETAAAVSMIATFVLPCGWVVMLFIFSFLFLSPGSRLDLGATYIPVGKSLCRLRGKSMIISAVVL